MEITFQIIFWTLILLIFHSYIFFPISIKLLAKSKSQNDKIYKKEDDLPYVSILMAVHNEESIIRKKVESVYTTDYPIEKLKLYVGSDCSNDGTDNILEKLSEKYPGFYHQRFEKRKGKPGIINQLYRNSEGEIIIITDANVIFRKNTIYELVKHFKNNEIGLTDTIIINPSKSMKKTGISLAENKYLLRETEIKRNEGILWGTMMGPFGGCYAVRKSLYEEVPENFLVDDFYINMKVLLSGKCSINSLEAIVNEDVSDNIKVEFQRKVRISAGNFQNLKKFFSVLFSKRKGLSYSFFSHKILRWIGPFIILFTFISNLFLIKILLYRIILIFFIFNFIIPLIDYLFRLFRINLRFLRYISHFYAMNLALSVGFLKFISGIKSGIWKPTERN